MSHPTPWQRLRQYSWVPIISAQMIAQLAMVGLCQRSIAADQRRFLQPLVGLVRFLGWYSEAPDNQSLRP